MNNFFNIFNAMLIVLYPIIAILSCIAVGIFYGSVFVAITWGILACFIFILIIAVVGATYGR